MFTLFSECPILLLPIFGIFSKIKVNFEICVPLDRNLAMDLFMMLQEVGKCFLKKESIILHVLCNCAENAFNNTTYTIYLIVATHEK